MPACYHTDGTDQVPIMDGKGRQVGYHLRCRTCGFIIMTEYWGDATVS